MIHDFLPVCRADMEKRGWDQCDFVYICGDAYVDHPSFGSAIISRVLEFLKYCKENGIRTGIGTSNGSEIVDAVLTSLNVKEYFDAVVTACEVAHGKPEPDIYLEVAKRLGVQPENCLVFEDIPAGIMAGKAAGMPVIAMEDDFSADLMDEKRELADAVISDYRELL